MDNFTIRECVCVADRAEGQPFKTFRITDAEFPDPGRAIAVSTGIRPKGSLTITNLDAVTEYFLMDSIKDIMAEVKSERYMLVFDLTEFPYITAGVHLEEPERGDDQFGKDVYRVWSTYDQEKEIPVIIVNVELSRTVLKLIRLLEHS